MKKYLSLILICCLLFGVCACSGNTDEPASSEEAVEAVDYSYITPDSLELYVDTNDSIGSSNQSSGQATRMSAVAKGNAKDAEIDLYFSEDYEDVTQSNTSQKKTLKISSQEYELSYITTRVYSNKNTTNKYLNRSVDIYSWTNGGNKTVSLRILSDTKKLVKFYYSYNNIRKWAEGDIVHDEATLRGIADEILTSNIEQEELEDYVAREIPHPKEFRNRYGLYYDMYIYGYQTRETIYIIMDQDKNIIDCDFEKLGIFNGIKEKFSKEHIDAVANALQSKIENTINMANAQISEPVLTLDSDGCLYVAVQIRYPSTVNDEIVYAKVG